MKRIESCPSIVDSVSFFDNDANIADSFHADLAPLPAAPINNLDSGAVEFSFVLVRAGLGARSR